MRWNLFTFCSAISLLMCAAICVLWVRTYLVPTVGEETIYISPSLRVVLERAGGLRLTTAPQDGIFACAPAAIATAVLPGCWAVIAVRSRGARTRAHGFPMGACCAVVPLGDEPVGCASAHHSTSGVLKHTLPDSTSVDAEPGHVG